jgi:hypothetical protein
MVWAVVVLAQPQMGHWAAVSAYVVPQMSQITLLILLPPFQKISKIALNYCSAALLP